MAFKPRATKLSGFKFSPVDRNGTGISIMVNGLSPSDKVEICDSNGTRSTVLLRDLLWSAEVLKSFEKRFHCVCAQHGSFISEIGERQAPTCNECLNETRSDMASDMVEEEVDA